MSGTTTRSDELAGKVALVTGGSGGIGRAICLALADAGAAVAVNYHSSRDRADEVVAEIGARGGSAMAIQADVADHDAVRKMVAAVIDSLGDLHILVNNAGIAKDALIYKMPPQDWLDVMRVNFGGVFNCTAAVMDQMMGNHAGAIVNVSSVMGERAWVGDSNYAASKAAINAFTRCSALELARFGVRVNAVLPGFVPTAMVDAVVGKDEGKGLLPQIPLRTFAAAEEVASVVVFLAGPSSGHMTGSLVVVDGGTSSTLGVGSPLQKR